MLTNSDATVYNKYVDSRTETYQRAQIVGVQWENRKAANVLATGGNIAADAVTVYIPFANAPVNYLNPVAWRALGSKSGCWTLQTGDVLVKGLVNDDIDESFTLSDLKRTYDDVLVISSVDTMDYGSDELQHWQVGAK